MRWNPLRILSTEVVIATARVPRHSNGTSAGCTRISGVRIENTQLATAQMREVYFDTYGQCPYVEFGTASLQAQRTWTKPNSGRIF